VKNIGIDKEFLNRILIAQEIIARFDKWDCTGKETISRVKRHPTE
jgi:hypothetical protein